MKYAIASFQRSLLAPHNPNFSSSSLIRSFTLKTTDGFDELIENGLTVEVMKEGGEVAGQVGVGCSVTLTCTALKWEPSRGVARR